MRSISISQKKIGIIHRRAVKLRQSVLQCNMGKPFLYDDKQITQGQTSIRS